MNLKSQKKSIPMLSSINWIPYVCYIFLIIIGMLKIYCSFFDCKLFEKEPNALFMFLFFNFYCNYYHYQGVNIFFMFF